MQEFPKWVIAHPSHIIDGWAPYFDQTNWDSRNRSWMVLVKDEAEAVFAAEPVKNYIVAEGPADGK